MDNNIIYHFHHITPKHTWKQLYGSLDGCDNPDNLIKLTVHEHAAWHYELWVYFGFLGDWIAWKMLSGQCDDEEYWKQIAKLRGPLISQALKGKTRKSSEKRKIGAKNRAIEKGKWKGSDNPGYSGELNRKLKSRNWKFVNPEGVVVEIFNLKEYCRNNNLCAPQMYRLAKGKTTEHKGWKNL